jgi:uncharacterized protein (TIGR02996 family)
MTVASLDRSTRFGAPAASTSTSIATFVPPIPPRRRSNVPRRQAIRLSDVPSHAAALWDDEGPRFIYANWLDEQGEYEEADRERNYVASVRWLRAFAQEHSQDFTS